MVKYSSNLPMGSKWPEVGSNKYTDLVIHEKKLTSAKKEQDRFSEMNEIKLTEVMFSVVELFHTHLVCIIMYTLGAPSSHSIYNHGCVLHAFITFTFLKL